MKRTGLDIDINRDCKKSEMIVPDIPFYWIDYNPVYKDGKATTKEYTAAIEALQIKQLCNWVEITSDVLYDFLTKKGTARYQNVLYYQTTHEFYKDCPSTVKHSNNEYSNKSSLCLLAPNIPFEWILRCIPGMPQYHVARQALEIKRLLGWTEVTQEILDGFFLNIGGTKGYEVLIEYVNNPKTKAVPEKIDLQKVKSAFELIKETGHISTILANELNTSEKEEIKVLVMGAMKEIPWDITEILDELN